MVVVVLLVVACDYRGAGGVTMMAVMLTMLVAKADVIVTFTEHNLIRLMCISMAARSDFKCTRPHGVKKAYTPAQNTNESCSNCWSLRVRLPTDQE